MNYFPADAERRFSNLVSQISNRTRGLRPNARLFVSELTPIGIAAEDLRVVAFNQEIADVVAQHDALGENVSLVQMHSALNPATDMTDALHPNAQGYQKMAAVWAQSIESVSVSVPEPSAAVGIAGATLLGLGARRRRNVALCHTAIRERSTPHGAPGAVFG